MTGLRDVFDSVHKKDIKNKNGDVVAQVDYIEWADAADRLDAVAPEQWSFNVVALGPDWCHGRLTIGTREYENIGYAENADMAWKKEPLKDAVSDAFKRCAALAGVARYLYNHSTSTAGNGRGSSSARPSVTAGRASPPPARPATSDEPEFPENEWDKPTPRADDNNDCPEHGVKWNGEWGDLWHKTEDGAYCRHPDNTRQGGRQKAGARR